MTVSPGVRLGPYEITALLGEGGMGQVYRATDTNLKRTVAIKVLPAAVSSDADLLSRFRREAEVLARLNHPNIAQIYGLERSDGTTALVMELVEGETLADRITRGSMPADEALPIARQIAEALEVAHEQGIIHRDLKPANVKLRPDGTVKLLDFGLAKALGDDVRAGSHADSPTISLAATRAGLVLGTPAYMSPEQAKGKPVDRRADIWSFGIVLFEMLAGRAVYAGDAASEIIAAVIMNEPDWAILPPSTPPRVRALLRRCLEKAPRSRLQAIGEARIALEGALQGSDESAPATLAAPTTDMTRRATARPVLWSLAGLLVGVLAAGYAAWTMQPEAQRATTRFSIALPDDQRFTNPAWRVLAISPNGDRLVYVANSRLYLRAMSEIEPRVLLGGETGADVLNPVFSPDGQSVAYHAMEEKAIKRLALSGGAAATVCAADVLFGMSWSEHGIVFGQRGKGILRVSPAGGTPEVIVPIDSGHHAASPYMLPGGQAVLFSMKKVDETWANGQVVVQPLNGGPRKTLVERGSDGRYLSSGHLVYAVSGVLFAVPFDLSSLAVGTPVPVIEGVRRVNFLAPSYAATMQFDMSTAGSLVYWPGTATPDQSQVDVALFDRKGGVHPLKLPSGLLGVYAPRAAPDGRFVAVESLAGKQKVLFVLEVSGQNAPRRLILDGNNFAPVWSHDSQWILFQSDREGDGAIFRQRADGSGPAERLTKPAAGEGHSPQSVTFDGARLLFSVEKGSRPQESALWTLNLQDKSVQPLGIAPAREAAFSPDGKWIVYSSPSGIYIEPFPRTGAKHLVHPSGDHPLWSPKGDEIILNEGEGRSLSVAVTTRPRVAIGRPRDFPRMGRWEPPPLGAMRRAVDMLPDGQRFVGVLSASEAGPAIIVVLNWNEELKRSVPTK